MYEKERYEIKAYDGSKVFLYNETIDHILRKHKEMISILNLKGNDLVKLIINTLENPNQIYIDNKGGKYFLKKYNELYFNVIVHENIIRTAYLISSKTYLRMVKKRWLQRLY